MASVSNLPLQVSVTSEAANLIKELQKEHGDIFFHQSGGCCDGSTPYCYAEGDFVIGVNDVLLGTVEGAPFYMHKAQFDYWKHTQLILDAKNGSGSEFSLEHGSGKSFFVKSRVFTQEEYEALKAAGRI